MHCFALSGTNNDDTVAEILNSVSPYQGHTSHPFMKLSFVSNIFMLLLFEYRGMVFIYWSGLYRFWWFFRTRRFPLASATTLSFFCNK